MGARSVASAWRGEDASAKLARKTGGRYCRFVESNSTYLGRFVGLGWGWGWGGHRRFRFGGKQQLQRSSNLACFFRPNQNGPSCRPTAASFHLPTKVPHVRQIAIERGNGGVRVRALLPFTAPLLKKKKNARAKLSGSLAFGLSRALCLLCLSPRFAACQDCSPPAREASSIPRPPTRSPAARTPVPSPRTVPPPPLCH